MPSKTGHVVAKEGERQEDKKRKKKATALRKPQERRGSL
jgi:hypothetical protein